MNSIYSYSHFREREKERESLGVFHIVVVQVERCGIEWSKFVESPKKCVEIVNWSLWPGIE
jgi:hypothetical protein